MDNFYPAGTLIAAKHNPAMDKRLGLISEDAQTYYFLTLESFTRGGEFGYTAEPEVWDLAYGDIFCLTFYLDNIYEFFPPDDTIT